MEGEGGRDSRRDYGVEEEHRCVGYAGGWAAGEDEFRESQELGEEDRGLFCVGRGDCEGEDGGEDDVGGGGEGSEGEGAEEQGGAGARRRELTVIKL